MIKLDDKKALVLFSGGQDSTVVLAWALERYHEVATIGFDYAQRHAIELECRGKIREGLTDRFPNWAPKLGGDTVVDLSVLSEISETALTHNIEMAMGRDGLPTTFVPGRNLMFLTVAGAVAYRSGIANIASGVCETDYSGYPDCRDATIKAMEKSLSLGMDTSFTLHSPLMWIDKAATWALAEEIGGKILVDLIVEETHTCYQGDRSVRHAWGYGCGACSACDLRAKGWNTYRVQGDP